MNREEMKEALALLVDIQESAAPIEVSIGRIKDNMVQGDCLIIKQAPPVVANKLIQEGYHLDILKEGVSVMKF